MANLFASLPVRANGQTVRYTWFNAIRSALIAAFGAGAIEETSFTLANAQAAADVTGLLFAAASYRTALIKFEVSRKTDTASSEVRSVHWLTIAYRAQDTAWEVLEDRVCGDDDGVTLTVTSVGQVQYATSSIAGSNYAGNCRFKAETFNA